MDPNALQSFALVSLKTGTLRCIRRRTRALAVGVHKFLAWDGDWGAMAGGGHQCLVGPKNAHTPDP